MDKFKLLSGEQLVALGWKKTNCSLPELGLKDVVSNGSWLEQKHVQNALEARRDIVDVERIEKCGTLSYAEWDEKLNLAEVTKIAGGHWQYIGHNVGKTLYIHPEEALLLMELNCLHLTFNSVTVSIQQAYSLLLKNKQEQIQYRVYASLSRSGYKIFRHSFVKSEDDENVETLNEAEDPSSSDQINELSNTAEEQVENNVNHEMEENSHGEKEVTTESDMNNKCDAQNANVTKDITVGNEVTVKLDELAEIKNLDKKTDLQNTVSEMDEIEHSNQHNSTVFNKESDTKFIDNVQIETENTGKTVEVSSSINLCDDDYKEIGEDPLEVNNGISNKDSVAIIQSKIDALACRELRPCDSAMVCDCFNENLPDFYQKQIVTVTAPEEQYIPRNVFLNNTAYVLNLVNLKLKCVTPTPSSSTNTYSTSDEANAQHVRRIRSGNPESTHSHYTPQFFPNMRFPHHQQYRQFNYWNQYNYNWAFQRPFFTMPFRFHVFPRMQQMFRCFPNPTTSSNSEIPASPKRPRKRKRNNPRKYHLESIKRLALKLKALVASGNRQEENIQALDRLVHTYNVRYETRLQLTEQLDVLENEIILETIDLDDDGQSSSKKRKSEEMNSYDENFNSIKLFSAKLKELEAKNLLTGRHRRAFSNVIRTFNKSYSANIQMDSNFEVIDKNRIVIASSSDSECTIEEIQSSVEQTSSKRTKSRKLRNPFYIMKQLSEKPTNMQDVTGECSRSCSKNKLGYSNHLKSMCSKYWLPSEDDFGRAEVPLKNGMYQHTDHPADFVYQFIRSRPFKFKNWLDAKIAYWLSCKESALKYVMQTQNATKIKLNSIINPEDCTNLRSVLKKLSVIKTKKDVLDECSLRVHFDVYHRDVPNFRKTKKPKPHFRMICIEEASPFLTGIEFATLHSQYSDDVAIICAVVGSSSISYLQMNPIELPIYITNSNLP